MSAVEGQAISRDNDRVVLPAGAPAWTRRWMIAAGVYNLVWGAVVIAFPNLLFDLTGMERPFYRQIWQCVGMIVGVYGIGYLIASTNTRVHWPIVFVGLLGKIFGPIGFAGALLQGEFPPAFGLTILTNDLIWWAPFSMMLWDAFRSRGELTRGQHKSPREALASTHDQHGDTLLALSERTSLYVVFVRHAGCTFCKETLADLAEARSAIEREGHEIVVVGMSPEQEGVKLLDSTGLGGARYVSDPGRELYQAFDLARGTFRQLFGLRVIVRGAVAFFRGHRVGKLEGDGLQMPGTFIVEHGEIQRAHRHQHAGERHDLADFACTTEYAA